MHCLNLSASAIVKVSAPQNAENVARKVVKMFKTSSKKTALMRSCIKKISLVKEKQILAAQVAEW